MRNFKYLQLISPAFPHKIPIKKSLDGVVENAMNFISFLLAYRKAELRQFLGQYRRAWRHKRAGVSIGQFKILGLCAQKFCQMLAVQFPFVEGILASGNYKRWSGVLDRKSVV